MDEYEMLKKQLKACWPHCDTEEKTIIGARGLQVIFRDAQLCVFLKPDRRPAEPYRLGFEEFTGLWDMSVYTRNAWVRNSLTGLDPTLNEIRIIREKRLEAIAKSQDSEHQSPFEKLFVKVTQHSDSGSAATSPVYDRDGMPTAYWCTRCRAQSVFRPRETHRVKCCPFCEAKVER